MVSESLFVSFTVKGKVQLVLGGKLGHQIFNVIHATGTFAHSLRGEVSVAARSVPVSEKLGRERDVNVLVLSDSTKQVKCYPEVVSDRNSFAGTDLELPLSGQNLSLVPEMLMPA
jgi:hypothetical protein